MSTWYERGRDALIPTYEPIPIHFERGEGPYLFDEEGRRYLDGLAGIAVNILGYRHPRMVEVGQEAVNDIQHVSNLFRIKRQVKLAEALSREGFESSAFFCNSGAEANEAAIKFARKYSGRFGDDARTVVSLEGSFHGRSLGALAATGQKKYRSGFGPLPGGFQHVPPNDIDALEAAIDESVCALMMEPIQGEGGVIPLEESYLKQVRELCDRHDVLLVFDEVQTGMGRSGRFFCYQHYPVRPDVVTLAKGIAGGYPMGALLVKRSLREGLQSTEHASTFGGNPFVSRMALETIRILEEEELIENATRRGQQLLQGLRQLSGRFEPVGEPRGLGLMLALPLEDPLEASEVMNRALDHGLVLGTAGSNSLRFVPPLILTERNVETMVEKCEATLEESLS